MLNRREKWVMRAIFDEGKEKGVAIMTTEEILLKLPIRLDVNEGDIPRILRTIEVENYAEVTKTKRDGETAYLILLKEKGMDFYRAQGARKRELATKLMITVASAGLGYLVKVIMDLIFHK